MNPFLPIFISVLAAAAAACHGDEREPTHRAPEWLLALASHHGEGLLPADVEDFVYAVTGRRGAVAIGEGNVPGPISARTHELNVELDGLPWLHVLEVGPGASGERTNVAAEVGPFGRAGRLRGSTWRTHEASIIVVHIEALDLAEAGLGLPIAGAALTAGTIDGTIEIRIPELRWSAASGSVALTCLDCATGERPLQLRAGKRATGLTPPSIALGDVHMSVELRDGRGTLSIRSSGPDLEMEGEATVTLHDVWTASELDGCLRATLAESRPDGDVERNMRAVGELLGPPPDGHDIELLIAGSVVDGLIRPHPCREQ